jgi:3-oxoacyl-[acyl-carrier-protein] synthase II
MGVVSPIGIGADAFFDGLTQGRSGIAEVSSFDASTFSTRIAAEVRAPVAPSQWCPPQLLRALARDKKSAFGVAAAEQAIEMAFGAAPLDTYSARRLGLSVAAGLELFDVRDLARHVVDTEFSAFGFIAEALRLEPHAMGAVPANLGAEIIRKGTSAQGPYQVILSACAAGTQALGEAFLAIREGACDAMLAGGYDSMINPLGLGGFCLLEAMTRRNDLGSRASRPFDAKRDGFVLGEGAAFFVLELRQTAVERGARILAEIEGYGSSLDAYRVTDPQPEGDGAVAAMAQAMAMANVSASKLDYVNAHGTGTSKNDPVEAKALRRVLGSAVEDRIFVSSTKSQIGHLIGAAGAVEFAACLYALERQMVPATITLEQVDPDCHLRHVPGLPIHAPIRRVMSNSFGFGGQNASIVLSAP